jgi:hypothetical protein
MNEVYVVRNQLGQYWGKKKRWVDGTRARKVQTCRHEDEAINLLVELGARDIDLRGEVLAVAVSERGLPVVQPSEHLLPDEEDEVLAEAAEGSGDNADVDVESSPEVDPEIDPALT